MTKKVMIPLILLIVLYTTSILIDKDMIQVQLLTKNHPPSLEHLFGTDWLGRDMFLRTLKGLELSIGIGLLTAVLSTMIGFLLSVLSTIHEKIDQVISWLVDLFLSLPHLVTLILISFTLGGGFKGVVIGLALTHWPQITRVLRGELLQLKEMPYVQLSGKFGQSFWWKVWHHYVPHVLPQLLVGFMLIFPHAILHEASITFLGFGLSADEPAIGIILSESMQYLTSGMWWLAFFPGVMLLIVILLFQSLANSVKNDLERDIQHEAFIEHSATNHSASENKSPYS
ncbi:ABC transporter permease [Gracilibacillus sp. YIM 98692]|uniref:ABC transporter permease n=1 Tax=Gracilibacillus sp. YIM 98692 TaxID=2663532 RepID=UPI0013D4D65E|nr:ABC transporter permease [Gracilibacillus sp. YIM 98692]